MSADAYPKAAPASWTAILHKCMRLRHPTIPPHLYGDREGMAQDIARYVLTGKSPSVLTELGANHFTYWPLQLSNSIYETYEGVPDVYESFGELPVDVALRWAYVLEAAVRSCKYHCYLQYPAGKSWPELLLSNDAQHSIHGRFGTARRGLIQADMLETMLTHDGMPAYAALVAAFTAVTGRNKAKDTIARQRAFILRDMIGYQDMLRRHIEIVRPLLLDGGPVARMHKLSMLEIADPDTLAALAQPLCTLAMSHAKLANAATSILDICGDSVLVPMKELTVKGSVEQRRNALRWLEKRANANNHEPLLREVRSIVEADKSPLVKMLLLEWNNARHIEVKAQSEAQLHYQLPEPPSAAAEPGDLGKQLGAFWMHVRSAWNSVANNRWSGVDPQLQPYVEADMEALFNFQTSRQWAPESFFIMQTLGNIPTHYTHFALDRFARMEGVTPVMLLKALLFIDDRLMKEGKANSLLTSCFMSMYQLRASPSLLELAMLMERAGLKGDSLLSHCFLGERSIASGWSNEDVWPFFAHYAETLAAELRAKTIASQREPLLRAIRSLPAIPNSIANVILDLALDGSASLRSQLQESLQRIPVAHSHMIGALEFPSPKRRMWAAQWLQLQGRSAALEPLSKALAREKNASVRMAMLEALLVLGEPIEKYVDIQQLMNNERRGLGKGLPRGTDWLDWSNLPPVIWGSGSEKGLVVPQELVHWLILQAFQRKEPVPTISLRHICGLFDIRGREALAYFVLKSWLRAEVRNESHDLTLKQATRKLSSSPLMRYKGVLSLVAACAGTEVVDLTGEYLDKWYGARLHQCIALLVMLSEINHRQATTLLLATARCSRTKRLKNEAKYLVEASAAREGWSPDELLDRMISTAGLDGAGCIMVSDGKGVPLKARLLPSFNLETFAPTAGDIHDKEHGKDYVSVVAIRKEILSIVRVQTKRLESALYLERSWSINEWSEWWHKHPIMRFVVNRAVWVCSVDGVVRETFRADNNGSLIDCTGVKIQLSQQGTIKLAHSCLISNEQMQVWRQHMRQWQVSPLLRQFEPEINKFMADATIENNYIISDFLDQVIPTDLLVRRAKQREYINDYINPLSSGVQLFKQWPDAGLKVILELGIPHLHDQQIDGRLIRLYFLPCDQQHGWRPRYVSLDKVPRVLLAHCLNDTLAFAA